MIGADLFTAAEQELQDKNVFCLLPLKLCSGKNFHYILKGKNPKIIENQIVNTVKNRKTYRKQGPGWFVIPSTASISSRLQFHIGCSVCGASSTWPWRSPSEMSPL